MKTVEEWAEHYRKAADTYLAEYGLTAMVYELAGELLNINDSIKTGQHLVSLELKQIQRKALMIVIGEKAE